MMLATVVTTITTVSMSAICTNGEVKGEESLNLSIPLFNQISDHL